MNLNVFQWPYAKHYYLTHPWKWFSQLGRNIKMGRQRAIHGYCLWDVWELGETLLTILPQQLRDLADKGEAYPGTEEFDTAEKWNSFLHSLADDIEALQEEKWYKQNEYEDDFNATIGDLVRSKDQEGNTKITFSHNENYDEIKTKYYARLEELTNERNERLQKVGSQLFKIIPALWD